VTFVVFIEEEGKAMAARFDIEAADWGDARTKCETLFGVSSWSPALFCVRKDDLRRGRPAPKDPAP
jgi:hypothetical protein